MKTQNLGWAVAGTLALAMAAMMGSGFQEPQLKIGIVGMAKVCNESDYAKKQETELQNMLTTRRDMVQFMDSYRTMPTAELQKFRDLSLKPNPTDGDRAEIERIKSAAGQTDQKYRDLQTKANPTDAEKAQMAEFTKRVQDNTQYLQKTQDDLGQELQDKQIKLRQEILERAKTAVAEVAKKEGYTVVLTDEVAPYSSNNMTDAALKAMNAKK